MDTKEEVEWVACARAYVGEELFDSLLTPSVEGADDPRRGQA